MGKTQRSFSDGVDLKKIKNGKKRTSVKIRPEDIYDESDDYESFTLVDDDNMNDVDDFDRSYLVE